MWHSWLGRQSCRAWAHSSTSAGDSTQPLVPDRNQGAAPLRNTINSRLARETGNQTLPKSPSMHGGPPFHPRLAGQKLKNYVSLKDPLTHTHRPLSPGMKPCGELERRDPLSGAQDECLDGQEGWLLWHCLPSGPTQRRLWGRFGGPLLSRRRHCKQARTKREV